MAEFNQMMMEAVNENNSEDEVESDMDEFLNKK